MTARCIGSVFTGLYGRLSTAPIPHGLEINHKDEDRIGQTTTSATWSFSPTGTTLHTVTGRRNTPMP